MHRQGGPRACQRSITQAVQIHRVPSRIPVANDPNREAHHTVNSIRYRIATSADIPALARMRWAFRAESGERSIEGFDAFCDRYSEFVRAGLADGTWAWWIAEDDSGLIAHMAVCVVHGVPRPSRGSDQWGYLTDCYTRPDHRARGIGSALFAQVRTWAASCDLELLLAWPSDAADSFYARGGFVSEGGPVVLALRDFDAPANT